MNALTFEDGNIRLNGEDLPGILAELRVDGKVRFDEQKVDGASGKSKTPQGWEDSDIMVTLYLLTDEADTCYDKLNKLNSQFRGPDSRANPQVFTITNRHVLVRGVRQVVFSRLESAENAETDEIRASLGFVEHRPPIVKTEASQAKTPSSKDLAKQAKERESGKTDEPEVSLEVDAS